MKRLSIRNGVDLVQVSQIQESIDRLGERYLRRVFTAAEIAYCMRNECTAASCFAARFAAKEAMVKILRPNGKLLDWRNIEVRKDPAGWCDIVLHGEAAMLARHSGVNGCTVSLSHEGDYAIAMVTAEVEVEASGLTSNSETKEEATDEQYGNMLDSLART